MNQTDTSLHDLVTRTFATVQGKDLDAMISLFADDAVIIDPHFPTQPLQDKVAITKGFWEAMSGMQSLGYTIVNSCESEHGQCAAVETATHHIAKPGIKLNFPQVFIFEVVDEQIIGKKNVGSQIRAGTCGSLIRAHCSLHSTG